MDEIKKLELLIVHYKIMLAALNDIKDTIATSPLYDDDKSILLRVDNIAGEASRIDLLNPHNRPGDAEREIEAMRKWIRSTYMNPEDCKI